MLHAIPLVSLVRTICSTSIRNARIWFAVPSAKQLAVNDGLPAACLPSYSTHAEELADEAESNKILPTRRRAALSSHARPPHELTALPFLRLLLSNAYKKASNSQADLFFPHHQSTPFKLFKMSSHFNAPAVKFARGQQESSIALDAPLDLTLDAYEPTWYGHPPQGVVTDEMLPDGVKRPKLFDSNVEMQGTGHLALKNR